MKIVILDAYTANPGDISWEPLQALGDVTIYDRTSSDEIIKRVGDAEIVLLNKVPLNETHFIACPNLKYIGLLSTGYNIINLDSATKHGITVCNVPAYSTPSVVQHTFSLLLELSIHTGAHAATVRENKWSKSPDFCYWDAPLTELSGKTLGLIGFGQIGKAVAKVAQCFGMSVVACASKPRIDSDVEGVRMVGLDVLFSMSDVISLHCPQTADTLGMICTESIEKMKDGVMIINTSRGGLVNENDLADALKSGKVAGFGADVLTKEPPEANCPLLGAANTVITPHIAWAPLESRMRLIEVATKNVRKFIEGKTQNNVN